ncbi:hypothetical protein ACJRO0_06610 [Acetobacter oryzifermentans]|uniref:hypothetical protein n=1 Tax=Acetobacter TaxID=434 RepID=UPI001239BD62|nr:hypothetical protein [Acetobacter sp. DmW_136]KAA8385369.1 hypothetical protein FKW31_09385 [Acetobacter sp. DmW_136]
MTLAAILMPLLALCVVARGIGFLPLLGLVAAAAMLVDGHTPLQQAGAAMAAVFAIGPVLFLLRYQHDAARERTGSAIPFFALGLMVLLLLACTRAGVAVFPASLCVVVAGLVSVICQHSMVWQWAGLLTCVEGVLLCGVQAHQPSVVGVAGLAGAVVAMLGGMCIHRIMPRVVPLRPPSARKKSSPDSPEKNGDAA